MLVAFDIDGTLADNSHRLHHIQGEKKDWKSFFAEMGDDMPIPQICDLCSFMMATGNKVIFISGRPREYGPTTQDWLARCVAPQAFTKPLYMRRTGDHRQDYVVKEELLYTYVVPEVGFPDLVFDDRDQVVRMWRDNDIRCCQVADGAF